MLACGDMDKKTTVYGFVVGKNRMISRVGMNDVETTGAHNANGKLKSLDPCYNITLSRR